MSYFCIILIIIVVAIIFQILLAQHKSYKWTNYRQLAFCIVIYSSFFTLVKPQSILLEYLCLWLFISSSAPLVMRKARKIKIVGEFVWDEVSLGFSGLASILLLQLTLGGILNNGLTSSIVTTLQVVLCLYPLILWGYYFALDDCVDADSFIAIYQTHKKEAVQFLKESLPLWLAIAVAAVVVAIFALAFTVNQSFVVSVLSLGQRALICALFLVSVWLNIKNAKNSYLFRILAESREYLQAIRSFNKERGERSSAGIDVEDLDDDPNACYVLIIGESQNKAHMHVYGYERPTTPNLDRLAQQDDYIFFKNVYACHTLTMRVVSEMLTEAAQYNDISFGKAVSLLDVAKKAGYETFWISNHSKYGAFSTPITVLSDLADKAFWLSGDTASGSRYDDVILDVLPELPQKGKRLILIHMFACHYEYKDRYPATEGVFTDENVLPQRKAKNIGKVNAYDNAVRFFDKNINSIISYVQEKLQAKAIVFLPDHGEAVYQDLKHIPGLFVFDMVRIPMFVYFSPTYAEKFAETVSVLKAHEDAYFSNDMLYDTMLGIMGIKTSYSSKARDLSSTDYAFKKKNLKTMYGEVAVQDDLETELFF